jgi:hypothetical protein
MTETISNPMEKTSVRGRIWNFWKYKAANITTGNKLGLLLMVSDIIRYIIC